MSKIVAIDFELANRDFLSACAIGIVVYEDGVITFEKGYLIKPPDHVGYFIQEFIDIHNIKAEDVEHALSFDVLFDKLLHHFDNAVLVAHNAAFDMAVLKTLLVFYNITFPSLRYTCTVSLSRVLFKGLSNHKLNTVASYLNIPLDHHQAHSDAKACMYIVLEGLAVTQSDDIEKLSLKTNVRVKRLLIRE